MEEDPRYLWLEKRIVSSLNSKREALSSLTGNEDNKLVFFFFQVDLSIFIASIKNVSTQTCHTRIPQ